MILPDIVSCRKQKLRHLILSSVCKNKIPILIFTFKTRYTNINSYSLIKIVLNTFQIANRLVGAYLKTIC